MNTRLSPPSSAFTVTVTPGEARFSEDHPQIALIPQIPPRSTRTQRVPIE